MSSTLEVEASPEFTKISQPAFSEAPAYRTVSRSAVMSAILGVVSLLALLVPQLLILPVVGVILGIVGISTIRRYPSEYTGKTLAYLGTLAGSAIFVFGAAMHSYVYATEVPEGYSRVSFGDLQPDVKIAGAPLPKRVADLDGKPIFIKGYIHPGVASMGKVDHFILVPDMGTCCFGGQPAMTDMIEVKIPSGVKKVQYSTRTVKLAGKFALGYQDHETLGLRNIIYHLDVDQVR